jgi:3-hydroxyisobutyrate dehydrogenase
VTPSVALLGTGAMGAGMARNIVKAGLPLRVWNRTPERAEPLREAGARVCADVAEAVSEADVILTMLWDTESVQSTLRAAAGGVRRGAVLLQMSTVGVEGAEHLGRLAAELGLGYLDAPVLGTRKPAEDGTLVVLASGDDDARQAVAPVLAAVAARVVWAGPAGAGSRLKLAANAFVITLVGGIAQSLALARELGLDPQLFLDAVSGGGMDSAYLQLKGGAMLRGDFTPSFGLAGALKDADLIVAAAAGTQLDEAVIRGVREQLRRVAQAGHGSDDLAAIYLSHPAGS